MDFEKFKAQLYEFDALREGDEIQQDVVEHIQPSSSFGWPIGLDYRVRDVLIDSGIRRPYKHQADAIELSLKGRDVVLESPTASGKTLAFTAPMLHTLLEDSNAHALTDIPHEGFGI